MKKGPSIERAKDFKGTLKNIYKSLDGYKKKIVIVLIIAALSTVFAIIGPKILGNAMDEIYTGFASKLAGGAGINFTRLRNILLLIMGLYLVSAVLSYIEGYIMSIVTQKYTYNLRKQLEEKLHHLPFSYFDSKKNGEVLSIFTNDIDTLQMSFNQVITQIISSITQVIGVLIMMISINIPLTLVTVLMLPISLFLMSKVMKKSQIHFQNNQIYLGHVNGNVEEMFSTHQVISSFNGEDKMINQFEENNEKLFEAGWKSQFLSGLIHPIMQFVGNLNFIGVSVLGGYFAINGRITVGNIVSFISYSKNFNQPITQIGQVTNQIQAAVAAAERIFTFLEMDEEKFSGKKEFNVKGNVEFKNVAFGYDKNKVIIHNFSCKVKAGEKIAIVGPTGAGKTTIVKLLMNFYNLNSGSIMIDGVDIKDYDISSLRRGIGMVLQDTWLYSGTIMENLRYGNMKATDEDVINAAKVVNVDHFIRTLPNGYNMMIDEETNNISSGQKQLLTIARAILADAKILILDEATSNVDTRTEELIQQAMDKLTKGRTSFIIAHRLSTIKNADKILVLQDGDVVEMGNHEELLKLNGTYAKLYNSQFEE